MSIKSLTAPIHPGEILLEEFMRPSGISVNALAHRRDRARNPSDYSRYRASSRALFFDIKRILDESAARFRSPHRGECVSGEDRTRRAAAKRRVIRR